MRRCIIVFALALAGCASEQGYAQQMRAADPDCSDVASARARDAAINGLDSQMQGAIWQDSYKTCMVWKKKAGITGH